MSVQKTVNMTKLEQVAIASALQLEGHLTSFQSFCAIF